MVEKIEILNRGGVYLARLDPAKGAEVGKIRPVIILNSQTALNVAPSIIMICPLSSQSQATFSSLHVKLLSRDNLNVTSYALVEHCRAITAKRIICPRIAQLKEEELQLIYRQLGQLLGMTI